VTGVGVWAELLGDAEIEAALPELGRAGARIGLALPSVRIGDAAVAELTRAAREHGVSVRAWLLLPREQGYWIGESNAGAFAAAVGELVAWIGRPSGPAFDGISVDLEPAYEYSEALRTTKKSRPDRWLALMAEHVDPVQFERARGELARAVASARAAGLWTHAVTYPLLLDQPDGETILEDALDIPVTGIDWDEVSFMVYQTAFAQQVGSWLGPSLVRSYAQDAVRRHGARAGIDLGVVGDAGLGLDPGDRYPSPEALALDLGAAIAAGIPPSRIRVYGLAGMLATGGVERWLARGELGARAPDPTRAVAGVRAGAGGLVTALRALRVS
jgi:hypothetical protein